MAIVVHGHPDCVPLGKSKNNGEMVCTVRCLVVHRAYYGLSCKRASDYDSYILLIQSQYAYVVYIVVRNRYAPTTVDSLRDSTERALDSSSRAQKLIEVIDKHGTHNWLEPVMEDVGPYVQVQLDDLANLLEILQNFYEWKAPRRTFATISFFGSCFLVTILTDMEFCMTIFWFVAGGTFFLCWPIASRYPRYRYLVSPFKWVLWNIPTHAEWSFQYLRREAQVTREELIKRKVEKKHAREGINPATDAYLGRITMIPKIQVGNNAMPSDDDDNDWQSASSTTSILGGDDYIRSFRCISEGSPGRLVVFADGICFTTSLKKVETWRIAFVEIVMMRKAEASGTSKLLAPRDQLEIESSAGDVFRVKGMSERDEAFNTIIGFSGRRWRSLQPRCAESQP